MSQKRELKVGLIGFGGIGRSVAEALFAGQAGGASLAAILVRDMVKYQQIAAEAELAYADQFVGELAGFMAQSPQLVIEAAGQPALREYGLAIVSQGCDLLVTSIGAFTDEQFFHDLVAAADESGARILLASGALPAVDWLASVAPAGVKHVNVTQSKPLKSWRHTVAAEMIDLDSLTEPTPFFEGSAREAASRFPKSSNITAMLALVTAGLDNTRVTLIADPISDEMISRIDFEGEAGQLKVERRGVPSPLNPSTSADVPLNIIKAVRNLSSTIYFGP